MSLELKSDKELYYLKWKLMAKDNKMLFPSINKILGKRWVENRIKILRKSKDLKAQNDLRAFRKILRRDFQETSSNSQLPL